MGHRPGCWTLVALCCCALALSGLTRQELWERYGGAVRLAIESVE